MSIKINRLEEGHNSYPLVCRRPAETVSNSTIFTGFCEFHGHFSKCLSWQNIRFYYYHWIDTSTGELLVPADITVPVHRDLQFLNNVIINKN